MLTGCHMAAFFVFRACLSLRTCLSHSAKRKTHVARVQGKLFLSITLLASATSRTHFERSLLLKCAFVKRFAEVFIFFAIKTIRDLFFIYLCISYKSKRSNLLWSYYLPDYLPCLPRRHSRWHKKATS